MSRTRKRHALPVFVVCASFGAGVLVDGWLRTYDPSKPVQSHMEALDTPPGAVMSATPAAAVDSRVVPRLRMPIDGASIESLKGGFSERRSTRPHEAVDILAPRGTAIHAVQDGTIAKLFFSKAGGITIYQFSSDARLCFYYAHLARYADGLVDGQRVLQGDVIGYVGTSGNAPPDTPHLHFAVFEVNADRKWWQGRPLDPYLVFKEQG